LRRRIPRSYGCPDIELQEQRRGGGRKLGVGKRLIEADRYTLRHGEDRDEGGEEESAEEEDEEEEGQGDEEKEEDDGNVFGGDDAESASSGDAGEGEEDEGQGGGDEEEDDASYEASQASSQSTSGEYASNSEDERIDQVSLCLGQQQQLFGPFGKAMAKRFRHTEFFRSSKLVVDGDVLRVPSITELGERLREEHPMAPRLSALTKALCIYTVEKRPSARAARRIASETL